MSTALGPTTESLPQASALRRAQVIGAIVDRLLDGHALAPRDFEMFVAIKTLALDKCRKTLPDVQHAEIVREIWARLEARQWHLDE
jgi:hypothetical protein